MHLLIASCSAGWSLIWDTAGVWCLLVAEGLPASPLSARFEGLFYLPGASKSYKVIFYIERESTAFWVSMRL